MEVPHLLDRRVLGEIDRRLGVGDAGHVLAPASESRFRKVGVDPGEPSVMPLHKLLQATADQ